MGGGEGVGAGWFLCEKLTILNDTNTKIKLDNIEIDWEINFPGGGGDGGWGGGGGWITWN